MQCNGIPPFKRFIAHGTFKWFIFAVNGHVTCKVDPTSERFGTFLTSVGFLFHFIVVPQVDLVIPFHGESSVATGATERFGFATRLVIV